MVLLFVVSIFEIHYKVLVRNKIRWKGLGEINCGPLSRFLHRFVVNIVPFPVWWRWRWVWGSWRMLCRKRVPDALCVRNCNAIFQWYFVFCLFIATDKCCSKANESFGSRSVNLWKSRGEFKGSFTHRVSMRKWQEWWCFRLPPGPQEWQSPSRGFLWSLKASEKAVKPTKLCPVYNFKPNRKWRRSLPKLNTVNAAKAEIFRVLSNLPLK